MCEGTILQNHSVLKKKLTLEGTKRIIFVKLKTHQKEPILTSEIRVEGGKKTSDTTGKASTHL